MWEMEDDRYGTPTPMTSPERFILEVIRKTPTLIKLFFISFGLKLLLFVLILILQELGFPWGYTPPFLREWHAIMLTYPQQTSTSSSYKSKLLVRIETPKVVAETIDEFLYEIGVLVVHLIVTINIMATIINVLSGLLLIVTVTAFFIEKAKEELEEHDNPAKHFIYILIITTIIFPVVISLFYFYVYPTFLYIVNVSLFYVPSRLNPESVQLILDSTRFILSHLLNTGPGPNVILLNDPYPYLGGSLRLFLVAWNMILIFDHVLGFAYHHYDGMDDMGFFFNIMVFFTILFLPGFVLVSIFFSTFRLSFL